MEQSMALKFPPFVVLLHKLGLYLPAHTGKLFVRIPNFWTAGVLYGKAQQLGPINRGIKIFLQLIEHSYLQGSFPAKLKFDVKLLEGPNQTKPSYFSKQEEIHATKDHKKFFYDSRETPYLFRHTPL